MHRLAREGLGKRIILILVCIPMVQALLFYHIPGLNSDRATAGILADQIIRTGKLTLIGETPYSGAIRIDLVSLFSLPFGVNRLSLELPYSIFNSLTVLFVYLFIKRAVSKEAGLITALMISVSPWFVVRNPGNWLYLILAASLYFLSMGRNITFLIGGIILGLGCYEYHLTAVIPLSFCITYSVFYKAIKIRKVGLLLAFIGAVIGFFPRIIYSFAQSASMHMEKFNDPSWIVKNGIGFFPYFLGILNGTVIFLRFTGCARFWVGPLNSIIFLGSIFFLLIYKERKIYRPLVILFITLYVSVFLVIKYTAIRYFLPSLFAAGLISGLGVHALSLRYKKTAYIILIIFLVLNLFYIVFNFFDEFHKTGGKCTLFRIGTLIEASHHLVRTDILYEGLDKSVPVIVTPEPFILPNIQFYDLNYGHFKTFSLSIRGEYDRFYFIDYAKSKLGIRIEPSRFPAYDIKLECPELKNFSVYKFTKKTKR